MLAREEAGAQEAPQRPAAPARPRLWNSLEVSRLVMSAATPLMIFAMGAYLSFQSADQAQESARAEKKAAEKRQKIDNAAALTRENLERNREERLKEAQRQQDRAREDAIRADTIAREQAAQEAQLRFSHQSQLYAKRIEIWDKVGPAFLNMNEAFWTLRQAGRDTAHIPADFAARREAALAAERAFDSAYDPQQHYFSAGFQQDVADMRFHRADFIQTTMEPGRYWGMEPAYGVYQEQLNRFKAALEKELGLTNDAIKLR